MNQNVALEFKKQFEELMHLISEDKDVLSEIVQQEAKGDEIDVVTFEQERGYLLRMEDRKKNFAKKVEQAMARIKTGSFGECQECGSEIGASRLKARPTAELCILCKEEQEKEEAQLFSEAVS